MSGVGLQWMFDDAALREKLQALSNEAFEQAATDIGAYMVQRVQERFAQQQLWDGSSMPQSAAAKEREGQTLIDYGHLRDSYTYNLIPGGVEIGSGLVYAAIHHFGGMTGRGHRTKIIPRPVLGVNGADAEEIGYFILEALGGA